MPDLARTPRPRRTVRGATTPLRLLAGLLLLVAACDAEPRALAQGTSGPAAEATAGAAAARAPSARSAAAGVSNAPAAPWTMPAVPESIAEGIRVYRANYCGTCHHNTLAGTTGIFGPNHDSVRVNAARRIHDPGYTGHAKTPEAYVRESIRDPSAYRVPGFERTRFMMPAYTELSDSEVAALVRMLLWQPSAQGGR